MTIRLPHDAHEYDYEDQVSSLLLAHGYYLEARLILKKGAEEVLEFDAIATPVNDYQARKVVEVKSGKWGIADIFKLYGQAMYMDEAGAWLIHKKEAPASKRSAISEVTQQVPVTPINVNIDAQSGTLDIPTGLDLPEEIASTIFVTSWWSRSAERIAQSRFRSWCKSPPQPPEAVVTAQTYVGQLADCLFEPTPIRRVDALYDAYKDAPRLTSSLIEHISETTNESQAQVRRSVSDNGERPQLQYVMAQEYRARVAIIKNAYDALLREADRPEKTQSGISLEAITKELLPESFKSGMDSLREFPHPEKVPYFLQVFVEVFGGFYVPDDERELDNIEQATGIPKSEIPGALAVLDAFFPIPSGWTHYGTGVRLLKGVPAYLRGAGCFCRHDLYGKNWSGEFPQIAWQITNWHNALYKLLEPSLKVPQ